MNLKYFVNFLERSTQPGFFKWEEIKDSTTEDEVFFKKDPRKSSLLAVSFLFLKLTMYTCPVANRPVGNRLATAKFRLYKVICTTYK